MSHRIALFAGSFDPYTNGHHDIVRKAALLFDEVAVVIAVNSEKRRAFDAEAMAGAIQAALDADGLNARAEVYAGLVAEYCAGHGIRWYVRGLRNSLDYGYEENNALINRQINPALETIYLRADDSAVSSTMVRELLSYGRDISQFVPDAVRALIAAGTGEERNRQ